MTTQSSIKLLETGVPNLDAILGGGLPSGCVTVLAGPPGSGKTILALDSPGFWAPPDFCVKATA